MGVRLTVAESRRAARKLCRKIFRNATANQNLDDVAAAITSIDDLMNALPDTLDSTKTVKQNIVSNLPQPFKRESTPQQKGLALAEWVRQETKQ